MKKRKVCVVITARPSYARVKTVLRAIEASSRLELQIIATSSALLDKYGSVIEVLADDGLVPTKTIYNVLEGENLITSAKTTGIGILELSTAFEGLRPDIVVSIADRYETIAAAITASYMNIPLAHIQGGEVTGSIDEKVRHAVTKLADVHFVSNADAGERVIKMGENPDMVFITGCPSVDLAVRTVEWEENDRSLFEEGVGYPIDVKRQYIVVMQHPVTYEWESSARDIEQTLKAVERTDIPAFWFWPNVDAGSDAISRILRKSRERSSGPKIRFMKNLPPEKFLSLLKSAECLVGNSSVGIREAGVIGVPVVNVGTRQRGRLRSENVKDVGYDEDAIHDAIEKQISNGRYSASHLYGDGTAGDRISDLLTNVSLSVEKRIEY